MSEPRTPPNPEQTPDYQLRPTRLSRPLRGLLMGLGGIGLALGLAYSVYWQQLASGIETGIHDWFSERRDDGWDATFDSIIVDGFPFALTATISLPRLARPGRWSWAGPSVTGEAWPWRPGEWVVSAPGHHDGSIIADGKTIELSARLRQARGLVIVAGGRLRHAEVTIEDARVREIKNDGVSTLQRLILTLREPSPASAPAGSSDVSKERPAPTLAAELDIIDLTLAEALATPLGRTVDTAAVRLRLLGRIGGGERASALAAWRDDGGILEVEELVLESGSLELEADGTIALDADLQPLAAFTARIRGFNDAVDKLTAANVIRRGTATAAKLVLGALAKVPADGGRREITAPITVQEQKIFIGPLSVGRVPTIRW